MLKLENIKKSYTSIAGVKNAVLRGIDFQLDTGDSVSIVGPSGCGKSTLLNIMGGLDYADSGKVAFEGNSLEDLDKNGLASFRNKELGFVFQQHHLLPQLNTIENIMLPLLGNKDKDYIKTTLERAMELIKWVGLDKNLDQLPSQLSGGECQRVAVVRALINKPKILLADEPTGSLDEESASHLVDLLNKINQEQGLAVVMVTHSQILANRMKKCYKLSQGLLSETK